MSELKFGLQSLRDYGDWQQEDPEAASKFFQENEEASLLLMLSALFAGDEQEILDHYAEYLCQESSYDKQQYHARMALFLLKLIKQLKTAKKEE